LLNSNEYIMSFTTGGLFHRESVKIAALFLQLGDWDAVRAEAQRHNLLQARAESTAQRVNRELCFRLSVLSRVELTLLVEGSDQEQKQLIWMAICRYYRFIREFAVEVLREHFLTLRLSLQHSDFDAFFNNKAEWDDELDSITPMTRKKLRQVLFRMLREADLITKKGDIQAVLLAPSVAQIIASRHPEELAIFPVFESQLQEWMT